MAARGTGRESKLLAEDFGIGVPIIVAIVVKDGAYKFVDFQEMERLAQVAAAAAILAKRKPAPGRLSEMVIGRSVARPWFSGPRRRPRP